MQARGKAPRTGEASRGAAEARERGREGVGAAGPGGRGASSLGPRWGSVHRERK